MKKRVAVTMGEPGGVGPEAALRAVSATGGECSPLLIGSRDVLEEASRMLKLPLPEVLDTGPCPGYEKGRPTAAGGRASFDAVERAVGLAMEGRVDAIATAPISKEALRMAGLPWPGHTEMLAELTGTKEYAMVLVGGGLRVILVTIHIALRDAPSLVTKEAVLKTIRLARRAASMFGIDAPRIAVAGLNPHAGEGGMFGDEEAEAIVPAIELAASEGVPATGPLPPDTVFYRAARGEFDMVVCMYHDQGLIPIKLLAFETGVNVTVGLPFVRTSPDHGTAYDIAWKGKADPTSMAEALRLAARLRAGGEK
jgi:4-hydroxythreonine-4-phosphate dehydrogenase